jgi:hypothetical protein
MAVKNRGCIVIGVILVLVACLAVGTIWFLRRQVNSRFLPGGNEQSQTPAQRTDQTNGALPQIKDKPQPISTVFNECPADGDGGDRELNLLKNRTDEADYYYPVAFDSVLALSWPRVVEGKFRKYWQRPDEREVKSYEGTPVAIEAYIEKAKLSGPESTNCHGASPADRDFHINLTASPGGDRAQSIIVEMTPRVRVQHPGWQVATLNRIARAGERVRVSGWLLLDQEHPEEVGKTRGTIWEIHPVMKFEVQRDGGWVGL